MRRKMVKKSMILGMMLAFGLFFIGFSSQGLAKEEGLAGWWKFDEGSGEIAKDSSGKDNDGEIHGAVWVKSGLQFDGKNDYVFIPESESLDITEQITIEAWVKPVIDVGNYRNVIVTKGGASWFFGTYGRNGVHFLVHNDRERFPSGNSGWNVVCSSKRCLKPDTFNHIAGTFDSETGTVKVYANGECVGSRTGNDVPTPSPGWFSIGHHPSCGKAFFHGVIGQIKIYNRCLDAKEINDCYNSALKQRYSLLAAEKSNSKELPLAIKGVRGKSKGAGVKSISKGEGIWLLQGEKKRSWGYSILSDNKFKNFEIRGKFKVALPGNIYSRPWIYLNRDIAGYDFCILFRHKNDGIFYRIQFSSEVNEISLWKEGEPDTDPDAPSIPSGFFAAVKKQEIIRGKEYAFSVKVVGNKMALTIDGNKALEYEDKILPLDSTGIGFGVYEGAKTILSDLEVSKAVGALNIPEKKHQFRTAKWLGNQDWVFDNDEPILHMSQNGRAFSVKLRPGYRPQVHWPNYNLFRRLLSSSRWNPLTPKGNCLEGPVLYAESDEAKGEGFIKIGYDYENESYFYEFKNRITIKKDDAFGKNIIGDYDIEYLQITIYNPMRPAQDLKRVIDYTGAYYWVTAASPYQMALVRCPDGGFYRWPIQHFWVNRFENFDGLFVYYPDRVICPSVESEPLVEKEYSHGCFACCAHWDMFFRFVPIREGKKISRLMAGDVYEVKFRIAGCPREKADKIRKESELIPGHDLSIEKAYYVLGCNDFSKGGNAEQTHARLIWHGGEWDKTMGRNDSFSMKLKDNCRMYAYGGWNGERPTAKSSELSAWVKVDKKWEGEGVRLGIWRHFSDIGWHKHIWTDYFSPKVGEWQKITFKIEKPTGNIIRLEVQTSGKGTLWIDDLEFKKIVPHPPSEGWRKPF